MNRWGSAFAQLRLERGNRVPPGPRQNDEFGFNRREQRETTEYAEYTETGPRLQNFRVFRVFSGSRGFAFFAFFEVVATGYAFAGPRV